MYVFLLITVGILWKIFWGYATKSVMKGKNYDESWFWWGFFFTFIAFIVAMSKPIRKHYYSDGSAAVCHDGEIKKVKPINMQLLAENGWKCESCSRVNASYVGTCACGRSKVS